MYRTSSTCTAVAIPSVRAVLPDAVVGTSTAFTAATSSGVEGGQPAGPCGGIRLGGGGEATPAVVVVALAGVSVVGGPMAIGGELTEPSSVPGASAMAAATAATRHTNPIAAANHGQRRGRNLGRGATGTIVNGRC
jgi:hypothetical protein